MPVLGKISCGLVVALCLFASGSALAAGGAHVYLLRGIFNVSVGLDELAGKLQRIGISASVYGHGDGAEVASEAIADYRSGRARAIILIGHSLGAGAVVDVAHELDEAGVPVALLIALDPVSPISVTPNVRRAVDYYISGSGVPLGSEPGFRGPLANVDVGREPGMDHMAVQATAAMHARMISLVRGALGGGGPAAGGPKKPHQGSAMSPQHAEARPPGD
jgi:hypothetical protein